MPRPLFDQSQIIATYIVSNNTYKFDNLSVWDLTISVFRTDPNTGIESLLSTETFLKNTSIFVVILPALYRIVLLEPKSELIASYVITRNS